MREVGLRFKFGMAVAVEIQPKMYTPPLLMRSAHGGIQNVKKKHNLDLESIIIPVIPLSFFFFLFVLTYFFFPNLHMALCFSRFNCHSRE